MVEAKVLKKIPGYGYYPGDTGSFQKSAIDYLVSAGFVKIEEAKEKKK